MKQRKYIQVFRGWVETVSLLDEGERGVIYEMIFKYGFEGKEPSDKEINKLSTAAKIAWMGIYPQLKSSRHHFESGCKSNGAPKGNQHARKFVIPSRDEVRAYFEEKGFVSDFEQFFDYNETTGWENCKKNFMNWKAAAERWEEKRDEYE